MQKKVWENEYRQPRLVTGGNIPQASVKDFLRWLKGEYRQSSRDEQGERRGSNLENIRVLDLGCGNGKNTNYIASLDLGNQVIGVDISETALKQAEATRDTLVAEGVLAKNQVEYVHASIGERLPLPHHTNTSDPNTRDLSNSFDLILDVTSSNSLSEKERAVYLAETHRLLKPGGYFFVRALCKDGDTNAQNLLKLHPGKEKDTYTMPEINLVERVFSRQDFIDTYSPFFEILHLEKEAHYSKFAGQSYKRNFWVAYLQSLQK